MFVFIEAVNTLLCGVLCQQSFCCAKDFFLFLCGWSTSWRSVCTRISDPISANTRSFQLHVAFPHSKFFFEPIQEVLQCPFQLIFTNRIMFNRIVRGIRPISTGTSKPEYVAMSTPRAASQQRCVSVLSKLWRLHSWPGPPNIFLINSTCQHKPGYHSDESHC